MAIYIKPGFIQSMPSKGAISFTDEITKVLIKNGYPATDCCNTVGLKDLNFANDTLAAAGGVAIGQLYRDGNIIKIRLV